MIIAMNASEGRSSHRFAITVVRATERTSTPNGIFESGEGSSVTVACTGFSGLKAAWVIFLVGEVTQRRVDKGNICL